MPNPVLTIITVCFQSRAELPSTINSVLSQSWTHFEYLVVDGSSTDGTLELLRQTEEHFAQRQIPYRYSSEPDQGIYDAMNKGVRMAHGTWLLFLNAGDLLYDSQVLKKIFLAPANAHVLYGDALCIYQNHKKVYRALPLDHLTYEMAFCHQSAFVRRELLLQSPYDISYKVCADHHFFLSMYLKEKTFVYAPYPISVYEISGYSDSHKLLSHKEKHRMQKELGIFHFSLSWLFREILFFVKEGIKSLMGQRFIDRIRKRKLTETNSFGPR